MLKFRILRACFFLALVFLFCVLPSVSFAQTAEELQTKYLRYLEANDWKGWVDEDGDVQFKDGERTYFIGVNPGDLQFFRLVLPNIWPIESEQERREVYAACDVVNRSMKVVKIYTVNDNVWVCMEVFVSDEGDFKAFLKRGIEVIDDAVTTFVEEMP